VRTAAGPKAVRPRGPVTVMPLVGPRYPKFDRMATLGSEKNVAISFGPFRLIRERRLLERDGMPIPIGGRAFEILTRLLEHPGEIVSHRDLLEAAWPNRVVENGNLRFQMMILRRTLGRGDNYFINVSGRGYCFTAPICRHELLEL
jgi:DNA-binding winged helix-turn-helix (wHTH) protein